MKYSSAFFFLLFVMIISSCRTSQPATQTQIANYDATAHAKVLMAAFQQRAAEYRALCFQAYNSAQWKLDEFLKEETTKPRAIMTDIDETVLDNSPYQVHQSLQGKDYDPVTWHEWTAQADADTVPGALRFFQYAASRGVKIFYVSNRNEDERAATLSNLRKFGFPDAENTHLLLMTGTSSKIPRRDSISRYYNLIMQVGDNLNDLDGSFEKKSIDERFRVANNLSAEFGSRLIVLPNPSYGEWENALFNYKHNLTPAQKDSVFKTILRNY